jgi:hypothetical protein
LLTTPTVLVQLRDDLVHLQQHSRPGSQHLLAASLIGSAPWATSHLQRPFLLCSQNSKNNNSVLSEDLKVVVDQNHPQQ